MIFQRFPSSAALSSVVGSLSTAKPAFVQDAPMMTLLETVNCDSPQKSAGSHPTIAEVFEDSTKRTVEVQE